MNTAGNFLERPIIAEQFTDRYSRILQLLNLELTVVETMFQQNSPDAMNHFPPLIADLQFTHMLKQRIDQPISTYKNTKHSYVHLNNVVSTFSTIINYYIFTIKKF